VNGEHVPRAAWVAVPTAECQRQIFGGQPPDIVIVNTVDQLSQFFNIEFFRKLGAKALFMSGVGLAVPVADEIEEFIPVDLGSPG
jgi:hypothetical protein